MRRRFSMFVAWLLLAGARSVPAAAIYEVPEKAGVVVGAWDANILADDVHFKTASVICQIRMRLAIRNSQTCTLWIFDGLNRAPLRTVSFTNSPATNQFDVSTVDFDLNLQVPKDIYVGFSAQGDGWGDNDSDYWSWGITATQGVAGTAAEFYYGPVAGGQITTAYNAGGGALGCLQILSAPVRIETAGAATGHVNLAIASLPIHATNSVERSATADGTLWQDRGMLPPGAASAIWSESNSFSTSAFYRIKTR